MLAFRPRLVVGVVLIALLGLFVSPLQSQRPKVLAPHRPTPSKLSPPQTLHDVPVTRSLSGGLWMTSGSMKSYLHITNDLVTSSLTVTPVLWLSNGMKLSLPPVNLPPSGTTVISINQALGDQGLAPYATLSGYVELDYQWPWPALCATVRNVDLAHSVIFNYSLPLSLPAFVPKGTSSTHVQAATQSQPGAQVLEGLWWKQEPNVSGFIAFINPGLAAVPANLTILDAQGNSISHDSVVVSPHGTKIVELTALPQGAGSSGGLRVQYEGQADDLLVSGGLRDEATGYSANIGFAPPSPSVAQASTVSYAELGLMTGAADPMLAFPAGTVFTPYTVARNISSQPIVFTPNLWWMAGGSARSTTLPQLTLAPYQSANLNVSGLLAQAGLKDYNGSVNLVLDVKANTARGSVLLSAGSVDQTNNYVFQVVPKAVKESIAASLSYWSVANGDDTMVTLWNPADEAQDFVFTLFYTGGQYGYPIHLEQRATIMFNVSEILKTGIPDAAGNIIPAGIQEGSAMLSGSEGEAQHILLSFDASTYNVQKATCGTHCQTCNGEVNSWITDNPFAVEVSGTHPLSFTIQNNSGSQYNDTSYGWWSSTNTSVATVNGGGLVSGVAAGALDINAGDDSYPVSSTGCAPIGVAIECPILTGVYPPPSPGDSTPQITSIDPDIVMVGSTYSTVTISGSGFGTSSPTVNLPQGVTFTGGQGSTDTQIILRNATVAVSSPIGANSITVTVKAADGTNQTSNQGAFTVDGPFYMTVVTDNLVHCPGCNTTVERDVTYQVMNFSQTTAGAIWIGENPTQTGPNCTPSIPPATFAACSKNKSTTSYGQFIDGWSLGSDVYTPVGCGFNTDDHWMWCPTGNSIGHLNGYVHTNAVSINGVVNPTYQFAPGTVINP